MHGIESQGARSTRHRLHRLLLLLPLLFASCGSVLQGPILGRTEFERESDAGDAAVFLRCRGSGIHGEIQTDAEDTRVRRDGGFLFAGSITFPTTERCYLEVRHPRYLTRRSELHKRLVEKTDVIRPQSWDGFLDQGPGYETHPGSYRPWPESEFRKHLVDVIMWLKSFSGAEQRKMARYVPDLHHIYRRIDTALGRDNGSQLGFLKTIARIEEMIAYPYPFTRYREVVEAGDANRVREFIEGGVLRDTGTREQVGAMYLAAAAGQLKVMKVLLEYDEPLDAPGCSAPLLGALRGREWQAALFLLRSGASIDVPCGDHFPLGDTMSSFAKGGSAELLKEFVAAGVPVDIRNSRGLTALVEAVTAGKVEAVKFLLSAGADREVQTNEGLALIAHAEAAGYLDIARELRQPTTGAGGAHRDSAQPGEYFPLPWRKLPRGAAAEAVSFRWVNQLSADPEDPGVLWMATDGGLVRIAPDRSEIKGWGDEAGFPSSKVRDLWFDIASGYIWVATNGGLARMPMGGMEYVETVGKGGPFPGYASAFLRRDEDGSLWFANGDGLYRLRVEQSEGRHFSFQRPIFGAIAIPGSQEFFLTDDVSLLRFNPLNGETRQLLDAEGLAPLVPEGPAGLPQIRTLALDERRGYLWIGTFRHGVFRMDIARGAVSRPALTAAQLGRCARSTVVPQMYGAITVINDTVYAQLGRCFGIIEEDNGYRVLRDRIDAGPVADVDGAIWFLVGDRLHRLDPAGDEKTYPSGRILR